MSEYDPGDQSADQRRRRGYQRENEEDDAWAAADEDDVADSHVEVEDLAAYYVPDSSRLDQDDLINSTDPTDDTDLGPLPPSAKRLKQRSTLPRETRIRERYSRSQAYSDSPSFRRSQRNPINWVRSQVEGGDLVEPFKARRDPNFRPGLLTRIPFWGILILVILGLVALLVMVLALVSLLTVL